MADLTVFPIPQIPNGYNKLGKKLMIHDLTEPEATSTKLINFENLLTTSVTYAELVNLITNNLLIEGGFYLLTDFQTVYDQMDFDNTGALKPTLVTKTGATEQIWVLALAPNQIASQAYSATYPNDKIQYDWTYNTTLVNSSPAKGRISERIDENNNRTDYDHREIKFIRYDDGAGNFTVIKDNGNASGEFLTFVQNFTGDRVKDNWLGDFYSIGAFVGQEYGNNVFSGELVISNNTSASFYNNTFSGEVSNNTFSGEVSNNTFSGEVNNNTFSGYVVINTFSGEVNDNTFSSIVYNNTFGYVSNNTFSGEVYNNTFSGNVSNNTFTYTGNLLYVTIADELQSKTIDDVTYPMLFNTLYKKEILQASNGSNYIRYFDGTNDVNTLIP